MSGSSLPLPEYPMASYRICTTPESLRTAARVLVQHSHVILDCEGHTLGEAGGKLSLLNLGVLEENEEGDEYLSIFVIDVLAFQKNKAVYLTPIFDILQSGGIFKVVFDGRMDSSELFHGHGVKLNNVLDLQLADVLSREKRGESPKQQLKRLAGFLPKYELARNPGRYSSVQKLNGMASAMLEHGIQGAKKRKVDHETWLKRPLDETSLLYAAEDICKIQQLYDVFVNHGYINEATLVQQSASYMKLHAKARPNGGKYQNHGLLPLAVFWHPPMLLMRCQGCERGLPATCFHRLTASSGGRQICFVCRAVDAHERLTPKYRKK